MVRDAEGMWKSTVSRPRQTVSLENMASHSLKKCPTCSRKVAVLFRKLDDSGQIVCRSDLPWVQIGCYKDGRVRDYSHVTVYEGEEVSA